MLITQKVVCWKCTDNFLTVIGSDAYCPKCDEDALRQAPKSLDELRTMLKAVTPRCGDCGITLNDEVEVCDRCARSYNTNTYE